MTTTDPTTGLPLPPDAIQRILYLTPKVHIYAIPPLTSNKGYMAAQWTTQDSIFTARLRLLETAIPLKQSTNTSSNPSTSTPPTSSQPHPASTSPAERVTTTLLLEDPTTGSLFAAAPYTHPSVVSPCIDSSRFFAIRVVGEGGRKATLGMGFEERSDAFDFNIALQDAGKILGLDSASGSGSSGGGGGSSSARGGRDGATTGTGRVGAQQAPAPPHSQREEPKRSYSLKEGQTITVNIGATGIKRANANPGHAQSTPIDSSAAAEMFRIQPPPEDAAGGASGTLPILAPPPSAKEVRAEMKGEGREEEGRQRTLTAEEMGFDDGEFGEFQ